MAQDGLITIGVQADLTQLEASLAGVASKQGRIFQRNFNAAQPLGRITGDVKEFEKSLAASHARVISFGATVGMVYAAKRAFSELARSMADVEAQMAEINAILGASNRQVSQLTTSLFALSDKYSVAFSNAAQAAAEFARQGLTMEETLKRTSAALALSRISGLNMEQSVSSLTSVLNTFIKESLDAEEVVNRLVAVDQAYAVSAGELADALSRVSSSAVDANVSLNQTLGLITAAKQITARSASVIGNSFKTMFTRLQRPEVIGDLESVGVAARDADGKLRPMMDILKSLATTYDTLGSSQRSFIAETVGGVYQINILKAIMQDLGSGMSVVDGAIRTAGSSTNLLNERMAVLNETISSRLIRAGNEVKHVFSNIGTLTIATPAKSGIEGFTQFIRAFSQMTDASSGFMVLPKLWQGMLQGFGRVLAGPGLLIGVQGLIKLSGTLSKYAFEAGKSLLGIGQQEKLRFEQTKAITEWLQSQDAIYASILGKQLSINVAAQKYSLHLQAQNMAHSTLSKVAGAIQSRAYIPVSATTAGEGYIPEALETSSARRGGYIAGRVVGTSISDGLKTINILANSRETISRYKVGARVFDFVNPPKTSSAGAKHRADSLRLTGIDPYQMGATGFIPNMGTAVAGDPSGPFTNMGMFSTLALALGGWAGGGVNRATPRIESSKLAGFLSRFTSDAEKASIRLQRLTDDFDKLHGELVIGKSITHGGRTYGPDETSAFRQMFLAQTAQLRAAAEPFNAQQQGRRTTWQRGLGLSIGASMAGGFVGQGTDVGRGLGEFASGLSTAGTALMVLPNKLGKMSALGIAVSSLISGIETYRKGFAKAETAFQNMLSVNQDLQAALGKVTSTLNDLENLMGDSGASFEAITRAQRAYSESIAALTNIPRGQEFAAQLAGEPDPSRRTALLLRAQEAIGRENEFQAGIMELRKYAAGRSFFGSGTLFGLTPFGASSNDQREMVAAKFRDTASAAIGNLPDVVKRFVLNASSGQDVSKRLEAVMDSQNTPFDIKVELSGLLKAIKSLAPGGAGHIYEAMYQQLRAESAAGNPARIQAQENLRAQNFERQMQIDAALNAARTSQRLYFNAGSLAASNALNMQDVGRQRTLFGAMSVVDRRESSMPLLRRVLGERSLVDYEGNTALRRIEAERVSKTEEANLDLSRTLVDAFTQSFDDNIAKLAAGQAGTPGSGQFTISQFRGQMLEALNRGIASTVQAGSLTRFTKGGTLDSEALIREITKRGGGDRATQGAVTNYLQANMGVSVLRSIADHNAKLVSIQQNALAEFTKQTLQTKGLKDALEFSQAAKFGGGLTSILSRDAMRESERNLIRGQTLAARANTPQAVAFGAATWFKEMQRQGVPVDLSGNSSLSQLQLAMWNRGIAATASTQQQSMSRVAGSLGRLGTLSPGMLQYVGRAGLRTAQAAWLEEFKPEGFDREAASNAVQFSPLNEALRTSTDALDTFAAALNDLKDSMVARQQEAGYIQRARSHDIRQANEAYGRAFPEPERGGVNVPMEGSFRQVVGSSSWGRLAEPLAVMGGTMLLQMVGRRYMRGRAARLSAPPTRPYSTAPHWATGMSMEEASRVAAMAERANMPVQAFGRRYGSRIPTSPEFVDIVPQPVVEPPAPTTQLSYKARMALKKRERLARRAAERAQWQGYLQRTFGERPTIYGNTLEDQLSRPRTPEEQRIWERNIERAKLPTAAGRKSLAKLQRHFGKIRLPLAAGGLSLLMGSLSGEAQGYDEQGYNPLGVGSGDFMELGGMTLANATMFGGFKGLRDIQNLKRGGLLAATGMLTGRVGAAIGGTAGELAAGGLDIGSAALFFGRSGAMGAGIGLGSELLRTRLTERYLGYTAGAGQGMAGAMLAGASFGGPLGAAVSGGLYGVSEGVAVRAENKDALALSRSLDAYRTGQRALSVGRNANIFKEAQMQLASLGNRENALLGLKESDRLYSSGWGGRIASTLGLTQRQFGSVESAELAKVTEERNRLGSALQSGSQENIARALASLKDTLGKIALVQEGKADVSTLSREQREAAELSSKLEVSIDVNDDTASEALRKSIIEPLLQQIATLKARVDNLYGIPAPARI